MKTDPFDSAFPSDNAQGDYHNGLTKREYFAGLALQGLLAYPSPDRAESRNVLAGMAISYADALIEELSK